MKRLIPLILFAFLYNNVPAQDPGAIGTTNLSAWFRADGLLPGDVVSWSTTFPASPGDIMTSDVSPPWAQATNTPPGSVMNYNTVIDFTGNATGNELVLVNSQSLDLLDNSLSADQGTFFIAYYLPSSSISAGCHLVNYRESVSSGDGIQLRANISPGVGRFAIGSSNSANGSHDFVQDFTPDILSYFGNKSGPSTFNTFQKSLLFTFGGASASTGDVGLSIGARIGSSVAGGLYDGYISEIIFYNKSLNATELAKVHSYLAIKYGITLRNTGGGVQGDYVATNGTTIWDADANTSYHNDVIGIGREDGEALHQRQSHTLDDSTRIYVSTLAPSNAANAMTLGSDMSYIIGGHNAGEMCATASSNLEIPAGSGIYDRIEREWRITNTNFSDAFNCDLQLGSCMGIVDTADLRLMIDDDGDFTNASFIGPGSGLSFSYSGNLLTVSGISTAHIPMNSTKYITIAQSPLINTIRGINHKTFNIYPNPAYDQIFINGELSDMKELHVYNILGEEVSDLIKIKKVDNKNITLNLQNLIAGVYTISIDGYTNRIVKK